MSATIRTLPSGNYQVFCDGCVRDPNKPTTHASATTGLLEVARRWVRLHKCDVVPVENDGGRIA